ncbi:MAG TPA: D-alanyl-D-alanine carboxypeptidase family protein [Xanthobacteraceae bacterium]|nr:D-alanyl-D-alanine carboxypeptidase family protein [Xanthobacteraceae bacterium]
MNFVASRNACRSICFGLLALAFLVVPAAAGPYILVDATTGRVIAQHEAGRPWYPASISKLMTVFVALRAMREGRVTPDTLLTVTDRAYHEAPSKMGFPLGTQVTLDNALKMLMVKSANDMAVVIAEGVGGSYENFIAEMNRIAAELGMTATHYANPNGLPDEGQITTARDMAILARAIYREFPEQEALFRIPALRLGKRLIRNHNKLIDHYVGADGMKTGFICAGGYNIVATATRGSKKLIVVVLGGRSNASRNEDAAKLFEKGFSPLAKIGAVFRGEPRAVESIQNLAMDPVDMRDLICGKNRRKVPIESDVEEDEPDEPETVAASAAGTKGGRQKKTYFVDLPPSMPPVRVYIGAATQSETQKNVSGDDLIPQPKKGKKGKKSKQAKGKKGKAAAALPGDEEIAPAAKKKTSSSVIRYPAAEPKAAPAVQVVVPASAPASQPVTPPKPTISAAERAVMSEGAPLPRNRKPRVLDEPAQASAGGQ